MCIPYICIYMHIHIHTQIFFLAKAVCKILGTAVANLAGPPRLEAGSADSSGPWLPKALNQGCVVCVSRVCVCVLMPLSIMCIYIYVSVERERETHTHTYTHVCVYVYTYMYT